MKQPQQVLGLKRGLTLPLLVFYGVGVTVGAGIFTAVNLSLYLIGNQIGSPPRLKSWRFFGLVGAVVSVSLIYFALLG